MSKSNKAPRAVAVQTVPTTKRRVFSAADKLRIVKEAASCGPGEQAALLRREGIYSSQLASWRKQVESHGSERMAATKRGRKTLLDEKDRRILELEKRLRAADKELAIRQVLIDLQKKVSEILDIELPKPEER